jgi:hypothetical protein
MEAKIRARRWDGAVKLKGRLMAVSFMSGKSAQNCSSLKAAAMQGIHGNLP